MCYLRRVSLPHDILQLMINLCSGAGYAHLSGTPNIITITVIRNCMSSVTYIFQ